MALCVGDRVVTRSGSTTDNVRYHGVVTKIAPTTLNPSGEIFIAVNNVGEWSHNIATAEVQFEKVT